ncbi:hypothetical protein GQ41_2323 [Arenibacter algicola]|uniref:Uncharacterized protein n=1 Tax=Arenibacter algicola TaxID=616991 RepID=A0ABY3ABE2_9FLAO
MVLYLMWNLSVQINNQASFSGLTLNKSENNFFFEVNNNTSVKQGPRELFITDLPVAPISTQVMLNDHPRNNYNFRYLGKNFK